MAYEKKWDKLDNAGKIFPPSTNKTDTKVFRFACELNENIVPDVLQTALETTLKQFSIYKSVLERGCFWYYLETSDIKPVVRQEYKKICSEIYHKNRINLLFEVTYYKKRINLEVFHSLSDGTGALHFLQTLIINYLSQIHNIKINPKWFEGSSDFQKSSDSFQKYYSNKKLSKDKKQKFKKAYKIRGMKYSDYRIKLIKGNISASQILEKAHEYNCSLTVFLTACLISSFSDEIPIRKKKSPVVISVPVNLRKYFKSETARNFFGTMNIGYDFSKNSDKFEDIISAVQQEFKDNLTFEKLSDRINSFSKVEHNAFAKIAPLFFKDICLKTAHDISALEVSASLSNVGVIKMPEVFDKYINYFDMCTASSKLSICICSYKDNISISFTSPFINTDIQRNFFRRLSGMGINVEITTNPLEFREE